MMSGCVVGARRERGLACGGFEDLEAAGAEVEAERPPDLRFVVDDEHLRHAHCGPWCSACDGESVIVTVRPPPGVSSSVNVPCIAVMKPWAIDRPRPTPSDWWWSPRR